MLDLKKEQQEELKHDLEAIAVEQPRTQVAALKIKRLLSNAKDEAGRRMRDIIVDIASEIAVKVIYPDRR